MFSRQRESVYTDFLNILLEQDEMLISCQILTPQEVISIKEFLRTG